MATAALDTGAEPYGWNFSGIQTLPDSANGTPLVEPLSAYATVPEGAAATYSKTSGDANVTVSSTGVLTKASGLAAGTYDVVVQLSIADAVVTTTVLNGGGSGLPWTFGQAFKQGDVPTGWFVGVAGATSYQVDVRNRWADGSVKFAVISGVGGTTLSIGASLTDSTGTAVSAITSGDVGTTTFDASGTTVTLANAINGADLTSFSGTKAVRPPNAGRLKVQHAGHVMREEHFYSPLGAYMGVFWYVRKYSTGHIEVETVVENGWQFVTGGAEASYVATLVVNGTTRYTSGTLAHICRTRWSRADWVGSNPGVKPLPSASYLKASKLVPNFGNYGAPASATLDTQAAIASTPFAQGQYPATMGAAGYHGSIGLLPLWDALYCTTGDVRAFDGVIAQARNAGRYGMWFRNEATLAIDYNADGNAVVSGTGGTFLASVTGATPPGWAATHQPSIGYLAYLLTGRWPMFETLAGAAIGNYFRHDFFARRGGDRGLIYIGNESREFAWTWRTYAQFAAIAPDGTAIKTAAQYRWDQSMLAWGKYWTGDSTHQIPESGGTFRTDHDVAPNALGCISSIEATKEDQAWMHAFTAAAVGYAWDMEPSSDATAKTWHQTLRNKGYDLSTLYALPPGNNYRFGTPYRPFWGPESTTLWFASWRVAMDDYIDHITQYLNERDLDTLGGALYVIGDNSHLAPANTVFTDGGSGFATGYQANSQAMLAYAVDHGYGASESWALFSGSSSYQTYSGEYAETPHFGVVPR